MNSKKTVGDVQLETACENYSERLLALSLIKQISHLCRAIQRHRGLGMSLIAGYEEFADEFHALQRQVSRRMRALQEFSRQANKLISDQELEKLDASWNVINRDWQGDSVMENFEYHSHFIEQLLQLMMVLARHLERPVAVLFSEVDSRDGKITKLEPRKQMFSQVGLLVFVCNQLPSLVEHIAKIRGLSTLAASRRKQDELESSKLRYFIQGTRVQYEKVRTQGNRLLEVTGNKIQSLPLIKAYEFKLMFLLTTVEREVLDPKVITMDSRQLFDLATEIIDVYLKVVDEGLSLLMSWQEESLESWFKAE
ncbi:lytic murein transglycosylase [Sessilibacter sp. MAH2]